MLTISTLLIGAVVGCAATRPPGPESAYRAAVQLSTRAGPDAPSVSTRFVEVYSEGKRRRETSLDGEVIIQIDRPDLLVSWILDPKSRSFEEHRISSRDAIIAGVPNPFGPRGGVRFQRTGTATIDGLQAHAFSVEGEALAGQAWLTVDGIPLRFRGTLVVDAAPVALVVDYRSIERRSQPAHFFEIPSNYAGYADRRRKRPSRQGDPSVDRAIRSLKQEWKTRPSSTW